MSQPISSMCSFCYLIVPNPCGTQDDSDVCDNMLPTPNLDIGITDRDLSEGGVNLFTWSPDDD